MDREEVEENARGLMERLEEFYSQARQPTNSAEAEEMLIDLRNLVYYDLKQLIKDFKEVEEEEE